MQLLRLEVRNWVHHRQQVCEFTRGLVGILGENGSGKSSLFGALKWLLTGENPNYGSKAENVSQYAKAGEPSYATLEFEHNGHIAIVTRHLLPEKETATLTIDGVEAGRGEKGVTAGIEKLLGVDAKFISRFIIVGQTEIFSFIDDGQSDTDKFFQRLFNTAKADKCQDAIGKNLAKISIPEVLKPAAAFDHDIAVLQQALQIKDAELAPLPTVQQFFAAQLEKQETLKQFEARERAVEESLKVETQMRATAAELESARVELATYKSDIDALEQAAAGLADATVQARTAIGRWQSYRHVAKVRDDLQRAREQITTERAACVEPELGDPAEAQRLAEGLPSLRHQLREAQTFVQTFLTKKVAECPTCKTPTTSLADKLVAAQSDIPVLEAKIAAFEIQISQQAARVKAHDAWRARIAALDTKEQQLTTTEAGLRDIEPPELTEEQLAETVNEYDAFQKARQEMQPAAQASEVRVGRLEGALATAAARAKQLAEEIASCTVIAADADLARQQIAALQTQLQQREQLERERGELVYAIKEQQRQQAEAAAAEASAAKLRQWTTVAEKAREALKAAPRIVAQRNLQRLESAINELLRTFQVSFQVAAPTDGTTSFRCDFDDGRQLPAQRLSVGQKTVLALAFRVAVNAMFAEEIGLLALDEPTASLDQPRIRALAPVLEKLRELSTAKGLQCLLVTHAASLTNLFESAITLEPPELRYVAGN